MQKIAFAKYSTQIGQDTSTVHNSENPNIEYESIHIYKLIYFVLCTFFKFKNKGPVVLNQRLQKLLFV